MGAQVGGRGGAGLRQKYVEVGMKGSQDDVRGLKACTQKGIVAFSAGKGTSAACMVKLSS